MNTTISAKSTPVNSTAAPLSLAQRSTGWFEQIRLTARHLFAIGCVGFLITLAVFIGAGWWAWSSWFESSPAPATYRSVQTTPTVDLPIIAGSTIIRYPNGSIGVGEEYSGLREECQSQGRTLRVRYAKPSGLITRLWCRE